MDREWVTRIQVEPGRLPRGTARPRPGWLTLQRERVGRTGVSWWEQELSSVGRSRGDGGVLSVGTWLGPARPVPFSCDMTRGIRSRSEMAYVPFSHVDTSPDTAPGAPDLASPGHCHSLLVDLFASCFGPPPTRLPQTRPWHSLRAPLGILWPSRQRPPCLACHSGPGTSFPPPGGGAFASWA